MDSKYIAEQATAIHSDNRRQGFWDEPRSSTVIGGLICSEMVEAFEAIRKNKRAKVADTDICYFNLTQINPGPVKPEGFAKHYIETIKDTVEAELAGTCIRCFDSIGGWLYENGGFIQDNEHKLSLSQIADYAALKIADAMPEPGATAPLPLVELLVGMWPCALGIQTGGPQLGYITPLASVIDTLKNMCLLGAWFNIDIKLHIALEVAYNRTRSPRHGGKAF